MSRSRSRATATTVLRLYGDVARFVSAAVRSHTHLAAENLFLRKQLALYVERQVKPRRADDATRMTLVALSWLVDWRRILTIVQPATLLHGIARVFGCSGAGNRDRAGDLPCRLTCSA
jgi:hypothetical protein